MAVLPLVELPGRGLEHGQHRAVCRQRESGLPRYGRERLLVAVAVPAVASACNQPFSVFR